MSVYVWALYSCFPDIFVCVMTPPESVLHVSFNLCLSVCNIHVRVHVCWLTIDKKQDQDQAAQGQREGSREKAVQDRAPNSPHCVLKSCVACMCICECVCVWMCTFDQSLLCDPAATAKLVHTHTHTLNWFVLNSNAAGTCTQLLPNFTSVQSDRSCCSRAT